jgi:hypothetical protein
MIAHADKAHLCTRTAAASQGFLEENGIIKAFDPPYSRNLVPFGLLATRISDVMNKKMDRWFLQGPRPFLAPIDLKNLLHECGPASGKFSRTANLTISQL